MRREDARKMKLRKILRNIIFGSKYKSLSEKVKIKELERSIYLHWFLLNIYPMMLILLSLMILSLTMRSDNDNIPQINLQGLNLEETQIAKKVLSELSPEYSRGYNKVYFTKNITKEYIKHNIPLINRVSSDIYGFNKRGDIFILYINNEKFLRNALCHEILHQFLKKNEIAHRIIYDLAGKEVCFMDYEKK